MKHLRLLTISLILFFTATVTTSLTLQTPGQPIQDMSATFNASVEQRDFHAAKEALESMIPHIKNDIKATKKLVNKLVKADNPEYDPEEYKKILKRKNELLDQIESTMNSSPAALRVKSKDLVLNLKEYNSLLQES